MALYEGVVMTGAIGTGGLKLPKLPGGLVCADFSKLVQSTSNKTQHQPGVWIESVNTSYTVQFGKKVKYSRSNNKRGRHTRVSAPTVKHPILQKSQKENGKVDGGHHTGLWAWYGSRQSISC